MRTRIIFLGDWWNEEVAASAQGTDVARVARIVTERLAQQADALNYRFGVDDYSRPHPLDHCLNTQYVWGNSNDREEEVERQLGKLDVPACLQYPLPADVNLQVGANKPRARPLVGCGPVAGIGSHSGGI